MPLLPTSVRARLTLWQMLTMAIILMVFASGVYLFVRTTLYAQIDNRLVSHLAAIETVLRQGADDYELAEFDRHRTLQIYRILQNEWPLYQSGLWVVADLGKVTLSENAPTIWYTQNRGIFHLRRTLLNLDGQRFDIAVGEEAEAVHRTLNQLALALLAGLPLALFLTLTGGYMLASRLLAPLSDITSRAHTINADRLSERLTVANPNDEVGQLAGVLNATFARLEESFERLRRFTQDAAHELRTPLTVLRSVGEVGLQEQRDAGSYREIIGSMLEEVDRLGRLVDGLLTLTRADSGRMGLDRKPEDLAVLCREVTDCLRVLAEDKQQILSFTATEKLLAVVDRDTLRLTLINIIANAIRFTPARGEIRVRLSPDAVGAPVIEIGDNGPGIAKEHQARLFERFYRVDPSRSHETGGAGLGLAIARWAAEANGGHIELDSEPGLGSRFRVVLPGT